MITAYRKYEYALFHEVVCFFMLAAMQESLTLLHANNKGTDKAAHPRSLISIFDIRFLQSKIYKLASCIIQHSSCTSTTQKTDFLATKPMYLLLCENLSHDSRPNNI